MHIVVDHHSGEHCPAVLSPLGRRDSHGGSGKQRSSPSAPPDQLRRMATYHASASNLAVTNGHGSEQHAAPHASQLWHSAEMGYLDSPQSSATGMTLCTGGGHGEAPPSRPGGAGEPRRSSFGVLINHLASGGLAGEGAGESQRFGRMSWTCTSSTPPHGPPTPPSAAKATPLARHVAARALMTTSSKMPPAVPSPFTGNVALKVDAEALEPPPPPQQPSHQAGPVSPGTVPVLPAVSPSAGSPTGQQSAASPNMRRSNTSPVALLAGGGHDHATPPSPPHAQQQHVTYDMHAQPVSVAAATALVKPSSPSGPSSATSGRTAPERSFPSLPASVPALGRSSSNGTPQRLLSASLSASPLTGHSPSSASRAPALPAAQPPSVPPFVARALPGNGLLYLSREAPKMMRRPEWAMSEFTISRQLYKGYASNVYKAACMRSGQDVVLKAYTLSSLTDFLRNQVLRELDVHSRLDHPGVVQLLAAFREGDLLVFVLEYVRGGSLDRARRKLGGRMTEQQALELVMVPLLVTMRYLHTQSIVHRDIKPENLLFTPDWRLKVCDYGVSIDLSEERAVTRTGSRDYMAPEVNVCPLKRTPADNKDNTALAYGAACDVWSIGALSYELLVGFTPFPGGPPASRHASLVKSLAFPASVSADARAFVLSCLEQHPGDRPTVLQLLQHPWIQTSSTKIPSK